MRPCNSRRVGGSERSKTGLKEACRRFLLYAGDRPRELTAACLPTELRYCRAVGGMLQSVWDGKIRRDPIGPMMRAKRFARNAVVFCFILALVAGIFAIAAWQPALAPISPPPAGSIDSSLIKRGAELAAIGDCGVCHTAPSGREFAGGVGIQTPFGTIYSTNITPDEKTGIGNWSETAFQRAMRHGVRRDGGYLYPAFPLSLIHI